MNGFPKKRFGQNFLIDPNILRKIVRVIEPMAEELIVEIGPGRGALTHLLVESGSVIHAIEIDDEMIQELSMEFGIYPNFVLHHGNALEFNFQSLVNDRKKLRIVGNIPYNISSPLLFKIFENREIVDDVAFLVQKEIAQRIVSAPNSKDYGILSVLSHYYAIPKLEFTVSPKVFRPIPKVHSAMITLKMKKPEHDLSFDKAFLKTVKKAFNQRRKILSNSLSAFLEGKNVDESPIDLLRRAETLSVIEFQSLTVWLFDLK